MNFIYIFIESDNLSQNTISDILDLQPDMKADTVNYRNKYTWKKGFENSDIKSLDSETLRFLKRFTIAKLARIRKDADITLWINLYVGDVLQQNLHLSQELINTLNAMGISVDITVINL